MTSEHRSGFFSPSVDVSIRSMSSATAILVPVVVGVLLYGALALSTWPYARGVLPLWLLIIGLLLPPSFFPLLFYVLIVWIFFTPIASSVAPAEVSEPPLRGVIVVNPARGRVNVLPVRPTPRAPRRPTMPPRVYARRVEATR